MTTHFLLTRQSPELVFNRTIYQANVDEPWKFLEELGPNDPQQGLLVKSYVPVVAATISYILFVCVLGPLLMRSREPFQLKSAIRFYNLIEVFLAGYLWHNLHSSVESFSSFFTCDQVFTLNDQSATNVYRLGNLIVFIRLSEYLDTIFFTLRKKQNQVTFLHVFHHAFVPLYAFWLIRTAPLRFNVYIIYINSAIHVVMYFYYYLATFQQRDTIGGKSSSKEQRGALIGIVNFLLRFKKYVTQMQIIQFVSLASYVLYTYVQPNSCGVSGKFIIANFLLALTFLSLFVHFYINSYKKIQQARAQASKRKD